jgi:hypothetical protein
MIILVINLVVHVSHILDNSGIQFMSHCDIHMMII